MPPCLAAGNIYLIQGKNKTIPMNFNKANQSKITIYPSTENQLITKNAGGYLFNMITKIWNLLKGQCGLIVNLNRIFSTMALDSGNHPLTVTL